MSDFSTVLARCAVRLHQPSDSTVIAEELLSALDYYKAERPPWAGKRATFLTVANQADYKRGDRLPGDVMVIEHLAIRYTTTVSHPLEKISFSELIDDASVAVSGYPVVWAWAQESLWLDPPPGGDLTMVVDYHADATRDEATGNPLTASSTTETNEWLRRGKQLLISRVMFTYSLLAAWDAKRAQAAEHLNLQEERRLRSEANLQRGYGLQTEGHW